MCVCVCARMMWVCERADGRERERGGQGENERRTLVENVTEAGIKRKIVRE